jgi:8-oxo-dGTP diphosphatase
MPINAIDVAASIVRAPDGRVLMAQRTARQIAAGFWELPGGKIDQGETAAQAAARELCEEVGIFADTLRPWLRYEHAFPTRRIRLNFFQVEQWHGTPVGREGQNLAWVDPAAPSVAPVLASNHRVLRALALPPLCIVTNATECAGISAFLERLPRLFADGVRLISVCEPRLAPDQRIAFARRVAAMAQPYGAQVLLAGSCLEARRAGVAGVHSIARDVRRLSARPPVDLWIASCHDDADVQRAAALGADAAILSPILPCGNNPHLAPIGWDGLARMAQAAPMPVYARGGMTPQMLGRARQCGAAGVILSGTATNIQAAAWQAASGA